jgi:hypothetical protein
MSELPAAGGENEKLWNPDAMVECVQDHVRGDGGSRRKTFLHQIDATQATEREERKREAGEECR